MVRWMSNRLLLVARHSPFFERVQVNTPRLPPLSATRSSHRFQQHGTSLACLSACHRLSLTYPASRWSTFLEHTPTRWLAGARV